MRRSSVDKKKKKDPKDLIPLPQTRAKWLSNFGWVVDAFSYKVHIFGPPTPRLKINRWKKKFLFSVHSNLWNDSLGEGDITGLSSKMLEKLRISNLVRMSFCTAHEYILMGCRILSFSKTIGNVSLTSPMTRSQGIR